MNLFSLSWPVERLAEAIEQLARRAGYGLMPAVTAAPALSQLDDEGLQRWLTQAADRLGLELEPVNSPFPEVERLVRQAGPALLRLPGHDENRFLLLLKSRWGKVNLIGPDLAMRRVPVERIVDALTENIAAPLAGQMEQLLDQAGVAPERREQARRFILNEQLGNVQVSGCWLLRLSPGSNFWHQLRLAHIPRQFGLLLGAHGIQQALQIVGWWIIVQGALTGRFDNAWLLAWALVLVTNIPFELLVIWSQSLLMVDVGRLFKKRLLYGTLQLQPEEVRHQGIGQFLGRVLESETLETLVLGGGFTALIACVELLTAAVILGFGVGGWVHSLLLVCWLLVTLFLSWRYLRHSQHWRSGHRNMINALIERMVGHRTRLAQEPPQHWHSEEDATLAGYLEMSNTMDSTSVHISALLNRGWLLLGLAGMAWPLVSGSDDPALIAISLGGIMLAAKGLSSLTVGMESIVGVLNAWKQVGPLFHAASRDRTSALAPRSFIQPSESTVATDQPLLTARDLVFRYRDYGQPVLRGCDLRIKPGDRLLLQGVSGGGKSTLVALLAGLRKPTSGLLLLRGLDRQTLGDAGWRQRVVSAPQFHDNHVLTETFAFNLLMGRRWPPTPADMEAAETICHELGLGELLQRMPAGLQQMVGESGWQLSHGERSRLYIARALLQRADLIVLDESFAALDPENLQRALRCVLARAPALMVIAHP